MGQDPQSTPPAASVGVGRRGLLRAAALGGAGAVAGVAAGSPSAAHAAEASAAAQASTAAPRRARGAAGVRMRWLGVAGWQLAFDNHVLYFDPYLSRFDYTADGGALKVRGDVIENLLATGRLSGPPEVVMVSHGHWDHMNDVPYLLNRPEWAQKPIYAIGTETHRHLLNAIGLAEHRKGSVLEASGGEYFSFADGAYTIQVVRSLHSQGQNYGFFAPGTLTAKPATPRTTADLLEGGTLAYQVTVADRLSVLMFGGTNLVERELAGLRPDVVAVSMTSHNGVYRYLERLLTVLGGPKYVVPSHHDDMVTGFDEPGLPGTVRKSAVDELKQAVRSLRLRTEVVEPAHLTDLAF
ncbi:MBL fold metallo-hydrolase [Planosporangium sp. 12N6]|uniref:MBL fold metallo-hydrolase n=1 Tax=Planosporangium spinosum TaxID=3402278 RepID=UPI003CE8A825